MPTQNLLNYQYQPLAHSSQPVLVFIHGLFGDMNNLGVVARAFSENYSILRLDLRNHGQSFHALDINYALMAQDVIDLLAHLQLTNCVLIGHSMGGKTAMCVASRKPEWVQKLVVLDIAPVAYAGNRHADVFAGLFAVQQGQPANRQQAKPILAQHIADEAVQQFMLKSFDASAVEKFRFFVGALYQNYAQLMDWQPVFFDKPTLFLKGGDSDYIQSSQRDSILAQFPQATSFVINGCGHWLHAEKPEYVVRAIQRFLAQS